MPTSSILLFHLQKHLCRSGVALKQCLFALKSIQVPLTVPLCIAMCSWLCPWTYRAEPRGGLNSDLQFGFGLEPTPPPQAR